MIASYLDPIDRLNLKMVSTIYWRCLPLSFSTLAPEQQLAAYPLLIDDWKLTPWERHQIQYHTERARAEIECRANCQGDDETIQSFEATSV